MKLHEIQIFIYRNLLEHSHINLCVVSDYSHFTAAELGSYDRSSVALKKITIWPFIEKSLLIAGPEIGEEFFYVILSTALFFVGALKMSLSHLNSLTLLEAVACCTVL